MKFLEEENLIIDKRMFDGKPINIRITSKGQKLLEEVELSKKNRGEKISSWVKVYAPWIIPHIPKLIELIIKGFGGKS